MSARVPISGQSAEYETSTLAGDDMKDIAKMTDREADQHYKKLNRWLKEAAQEVKYRGKLPKVKEVDFGDDKYAIGRVRRTRTGTIIGIDTREISPSEVKKLFRHELTHIKQGPIGRGTPRKRLRRELEAYSSEIPSQRVTADSIASTLIDLRARGLPVDRANKIVRQECQLQGVTTATTEKGIKLGNQTYNQMYKRKK